MYFDLAQGSGHMVMHKVGNEQGSLDRKKRPI